MDKTFTAVFAPPDPAAPASGAPTGPAGADGKPRSANAVRVARHKQRRAQQGYRQLNVVVPEECHELFRTLAARLRSGQSMTDALFDVLAEQSANPTAQKEHEPPKLHYRKRDPDPQAGLDQDDPLLADMGERLREVMRAGGIKAMALRRILG